VRRRPPVESGVYASPAHLLFDLNDFDDAPGPLEYDVARLSAAHARPSNGFSDAVARSTTTRSVAAYREAMADFAQMRTLDVWYRDSTER
jgi:hypothetical protein